MEDRFNITKLIRIERSGDPNDISNKWFDFSQHSVESLIDQGIKDALITLEKITESKTMTEETAITNTTDRNNKDYEFDRFLDEMQKQPLENERILKVARNNKII